MCETYLFFLPSAEAAIADSEDDDDIVAIGFGDLGRSWTCVVSITILQINDLNIFLFIVTQYKYLFIETQDKYNILTETQYRYLFTVTQCIYSNTR